MHPSKITTQKYRWWGKSFKHHIEFMCPPARECWIPERPGRAASLVDGRKHCLTWADMMGLVKVRIAGTRFEACHALKVEWEIENNEFIANVKEEMVCNLFRLHITTQNTLIYLPRPHPRKETNYVFVRYCNEGSPAFRNSTSTVGLYCFQTIIVQSRSNA